jgi:hypothetical protein
VSKLSGGLNMFHDVAISTLRSSAEDLPTSVTSSPDFAQITGGFDALRSATDGLREKLGQWTPAVKTSSSQKPGPYLKSNGMVDTGDRATVARVLWALSYGGRSQDVPNDSPTKNFAESNGGLTNPNCDPKDPENVVRSGCSSDLTTIEVVGPRSQTVGNSAHHDLTVYGRWCLRDQGPSQCSGLRLNTG